MAIHELEGLKNEETFRGPEIQGTAVDPFFGYQDYFGFDETHKYVLPDGKQYIEFRAMNEGQRARYEKRTSRDVRFNRRTDDAAIRVDAAEERHALIVESVVNWHVVRRNSSGKMELIPFSVGTKGCTFDQWLSKANPQIINDLHAAILKANPWMTGDMTVEMIDDEIKKLEEMRRGVLERENQEKGFANR